MEAPLAAALAALAKDDVAALSAAVGAGLSIEGFYWHAGQQRSLLQLAALAGAACCSAALLAAGALVDAPSPSDGNTALHCACSTASSGTARTIALLMKGGASRAALNHARLTPSDLLEQETSQAACQQPEAAAPAGSDLLRPEYCTDDFRMFSFKINCCPRLAESHDWTLCPFQHPGEKARRRDPRCFKYHGVPCPDFRKGTCKRGDTCTYAHGVFECWLHPSRYRTQLCKEGASCRRSVCFFAHSVDQLREPTMTAGDSQPGSPRGPLAAAEESVETSPRSWSPTPASSEDSVKLLLSSTESLPSGLLSGSFAGHGSRHPLACSTDSSLSSTPAAPLSTLSASCGTGDSLQRTLSTLSLTSEDMTQAMALQHHTGMGSMPSHAALLAATAAASWPMSSSPEALALMSGSTSPLASSLPSVLLPDAAAVQAAVQAAAMQHQLSMFQASGTSLLTASADPASLLAAATGVRQPLLPLSLNLAHQHYPAAPPAAASCYSLGL